MNETVMFLPGIIAPAEIRYASLVEQLGAVPTLTQELAVYHGDEPPEGYSITAELDSVDRAADQAGLERFHLFGHSGGGAVGLAYAAERGERLLSLAVDEPASDFTPEGDETYGWEEFDAVYLLPQEQQMRAFMKLQVAPEVELPPPPDGPPPSWMAKRPAGIEAFVGAIRSHQVSLEQYRSFDSPVYFSRGGLTHPRWTPMHERLALAFPDFTGEVFADRHHLNPAHQNDPAVLVPTLLAFWERAESRQ